MRTCRLALTICIAVVVVACGNPATEPTSDAAADVGALDGADANPADAVALPCGVTAVNESGVGKPCAKPQDCFGQAAVTCADLGAGAPRLCAQYCFGVPGECGAGALCVPRGDQPSLCLPLACAANYAVVLPNDVTCDQPCAAGVANAYGVGKPCAATADCAGQVAQTCPVVLRPDNPAWCSMLCAKDSDCGAGALCWRRETVEAGVTFVIGSCAPAGCCHKL